MVQQNATKEVSNVMESKWSFELNQEQWILASWNFLVTLLKEVKKIHNDFL